MRSFQKTATFCDLLRSFAKECCVLCVLLHSYNAKERCVQIYVYFCDRPQLYIVVQFMKLVPLFELIYCVFIYCSTVYCIKLVPQLQFIYIVVPHMKLVPQLQFIDIVVQHTKLVPQLQFIDTEVQYSIRNLCYETFVFCAWYSM